MSKKYADRKAKRQLSSMINRMAVNYEGKLLSLEQVKKWAIEEDYFGWCVNLYLKNGSVFEWHCLQDEESAMRELMNFKIEYFGFKED